MQGEAVRVPRLFEKAPRERLAILRILTTGYALGFLIGYTPNLLSLTHLGPAQFAPVGPVSWMGHFIEGPLSQGALVAILALTASTGFCALFGVFYRFSGPIFAALLLFITSYRSSFGMIFHTENLLVFHLGVLALFPAADAYSYDAGRRERGDEPRLVYGAPLGLISLLTVTSYLLAGIAKLRYGGASWIDGEVLLSHIAWDNLRKLELGSIHSPLGALLCRFPSIFGPLAWLSLAFELFAPPALLGPRLARIWVASAILFHLGVALVMAIVFAYPLFGFAFLSFFSVERPARSILERFRARRLVRAV